MTESCEPNKEFVELERDEFGHTQFFRYKVKPDGKCGYHAISFWLKKNRPKDYNNVAVTGQPSNTPMLSYLLQTVEYVKRNKNDVKGKCGLSDKGLEKAVERVKKGDYMETEELTIILCAFGLIASVYDRDTKAWTIINPRDNDPKPTENVIYLYNVTSSHFDLLEPVGYDEEIKRKQRSSSETMTLRRSERELTPPRPPHSKREMTPPRRRSISKPRKPRKKKKGEEPQKGSICEGCVMQLHKVPYKSLKF